MAEKKFELKFAATTTGSEQLGKMSRAIEEIGNQSLTTEKLLRKIADSSLDTTRQIERLARSLEGISSKRTTGFAGIAADADGATSAVIGFGGSLGTIVAKAAALKFVASEFVNINRNILETQAQVDKLNNILLVKNDGNTAAVKKDLQDIANLSERLGLRFTETATAFSKIAVAAKGSALEGKGARDVFEAVTASMAKLGVSGDGANRVFLALQQIISKGTVQTEELKGQLGEQIPGAMNIAARAVGVTTGEFAKMLEQGQVIASDFLPKFAEEMKKTFQISGTDSVDTATAALNRFDNSVDRLKKSLADGLSPIARDVFDSLGKKLDELAKDFETFTKTDQFAEYMTNIRFVVSEVGNALGSAGNSLNTFLRTLSDNKGEIKFLAELLVGLRGASVGAAAGSAFGPVGSAIGAGVGYIGAVSATATVSDKITGDDVLRQRADLAKQTDELIASEKRYREYVLKGGDQINERKANELAAQIAKNKTELKKLEDQIQTRFVANSKASPALAGVIDETDEFIGQLIVQGRTQSETFRTLEQSYKAQSDAIKGINKDYELQVKLAKDARAAGLINDAQLQSRLVEIENKYGIKDDSAQRAKEAFTEYNKLYEKVTALTSAENAKADGQKRLNEFQRLGTDLINEAASATSKMTAEQKKRITATGESLVQIGNQIAAEEELREIQAKALEEKTKVLDSVYKSTDAIAKEREGIEEQIKAVGLSRSEVEALRAAKLDDAVATLEQKIAMESFGDANDDLILAYQRQIEELKKLKRARSDLSIAEAADELRKRQSKVFEDLYRDLTRGLTDSIFRGFEKGKGAIQVFKDAIRNAFKTFVIKFAVQPVIGSLIGGVAGAFGLTGLAQAATKELGGLGSVASIFSSSGGGGIDGASSDLNKVSALKNLYDIASKVPAFLSGGIAGVETAIYNGFARLGAQAGITGTNNIALANAGVYAGSAAIAYGGYQLGRGISGGYSLNGGTGNSTVNVGAIAGGILGAAGGPIGVAIGSAIGSILGGAVNRLFGSKRVLGASGIEGTFAEQGFSGKAFQDVTIKRKLRSSKSFTEFSDIPADTLDALSSAFADLKFSAKSASRVLGLDLSAAIDAVRVSGRFQVSTQEQMKATLDRLSDEIVSKTIPAVERFRAEGENLVQTATRLSAAVSEANAAAVLLGKGNLFSLDNADSALSFQSIAGEAAKSLESVLQNFVPAAELAARRVTLVEKQLRQLGLNSLVTTQTSREEFGRILQSRDITSEAGQRELSLLLQMAPAIDTIIRQREAEAAALAQQAAATAQQAQALEQLNQEIQRAIAEERAQKIAEERNRLEAELFELTASSVEKLKAQRDALDESNRALFDQIEALKEFEKLKSIGKDIREFINQLTGSSGGGFASIQSSSREFNSLLQLAKAGDEGALLQITKSAQSLLDVAEAQSTTAAQYESIRRGIIADLTTLPATQAYDQSRFTVSALGNIFNAGNVTAFASGGAFTNSIASSPTLAPMALFGEAGPEAIMPLTRLPGGELGVRTAGGSDAQVAAEIRALREEVRNLRQENMAGQSAIAANTGKTSRILERVSQSGESLSVTMETA